MFFMHRVAFRMYIILTYQKKKKNVVVVLGTHMQNLPFLENWLARRGFPELINT